MAIHSIGKFRCKRRKLRINIKLAIVGKEMLPNGVRHLAIGSQEKPYTL